MGDSRGCSSHEVISMVAKGSGNFRACDVTRNTLSTFKRRHLVKTEMRNRAGFANLCMRGDDSGVSERGVTYILYI